MKFLWLWLLFINFLFANYNIYKHPQKFVYSYIVFDKKNNISKKLLFFNYKIKQNKYIFFKNIKLKYLTYIQKKFLKKFVIKNKNLVKKRLVRIFSLFLKNKNIKNIKINLYYKSIGIRLKFCVKNYYYNPNNFLIFIKKYKKSF